jgi:hypothetical protein
LSDFLSKIVQANNCMSGIIVYWNSFVNLKLIVKQIINYRNLGGRNWASTESLGWDLRNYRNLVVGTEQLQEYLCGTWAITWYLVVGSEQLQEPWAGTWTITWSLGMRTEQLQEPWGGTRAITWTLGMGAEVLYRRQIDPSIQVIA